MWNTDLKTLNRSNLTSETCFPQPEMRIDKWNSKSLTEIANPVTSLVCLPAIPWEITTCNKSFCSQKSVLTKICQMLTITHSEPMSYIRDPRGESPSPCTFWNICVPVFGGYEEKNGHTFWTYQVFLTYQFLLLFFFLFRCSQFLLCPVARSQFHIIISSPWVLQPVVDFSPFTYPLHILRRSPCYNEVPTVKVPEVPELYFSSELQKGLV